MLLLTVLNKWSMFLKEVMRGMSSKYIKYLVGHVIQLYIIIGRALHFCLKFDFDNEILRGTVTTKYP